MSGGKLILPPGVRERDLRFSDITTADVSTTKHGLAPKAPNDATKFLNGLGLYSSVTGGGASAIIQRPPLAPATPLDDFEASALNGAWSANSTQGSFATTDCITQARDGSALRMMFQNQAGALYRTKSNVDLDLKAGGIRLLGMGQQINSTVMFGIAALNSVGTGVGLLVYNDGNAYLANITTWAYASLLQTFAKFGSNNSASNEYWLRLVRTTNSWVGYVSLGGKSWGTASSASSVTITVDRIAAGIFYVTGAGLQYGALEVDWLDV